VESQCHQCGAVVPEGVPFCANCGAPQIRVSGGAEVPATAPLPPGTPADIPPPAVPVAPSPPSAPVGPSSNVDWGKAFPVTALAGAGVALLSRIPIVSVGCCLWALAGGALAVVLYRWRATTSGPTGEQAPWLTTGAGAKLGAVTAAFASLFYLILLFGLGNLRETRSALRKAISDAAAQNTDPNAQPLFDRLSSPEGLAMMFALSIVMFVVVLVVFCIAGGAIGASMTKPKTSVGSPSSKQ
jgi:hypothetical protein